LYEHEIVGKTVCVVDDYLTTNSTFDACRALLHACGANRVICVSIGIFRGPQPFKLQILQADVAPWREETKAISWNELRSDTFFCEYNFDALTVFHAGSQIII
jgi:hypothetical protein